jgi:hypothetical protein
MIDEVVESWVEEHKPIILQDLLIFLGSAQGRCFG